MSDKPTSNSQRVYQWTKEQILSGEMRGGQLLSEAELGAQLKVSRTPVHEAFLRLAAEDLLDLVPRRGAVVVPISPHEAVDLLEMRFALECAAARRLCGSPDSVEGLLVDLTNLIEQQRNDAVAGAADRFAAADDAFHRCVVQAAANPIAQRFYGSLRDRQQRMMAAAARAAAPRLAQMIEEHARLAEAIGRRDFSGFEAVLLAHLQATYRVTL